MTGNQGQPAEPCGRVLVVDDEKNIRDGCERILSRMGCQVDKAQNGVQALEILERTPAALVLLDLKMPGMDGMDVLERIREKRPGTLVVIITGYATVETAIEAMKRGAYDFIPKPFEPDRLRIVAGRALEKQRLREQSRRLEEQRRRTLADLGTEKSRMRAVVEALPSGVMVTNADNRVVLVNPAFCRMMNLAEDTAPGGHMDEYVDDQDLRRMVADIMGRAPTPEQAAYCELVSCELQRPGGRYLLARGRPVPGEDGSCLGVAVLLTDITGLKLLDKLKSEFVAQVSHELRSPLATIHQQISTALQDLVGAPPEDQHMLARAREKTRGLISLIGDLLDVSRIEAGAVDPKARDVDPKALLTSVTDFLRDKAAAKNQTLTLTTEDPLPTLHADPLALESIFGNLITNAITYTQEEGQIHVCAKPENSGLTVSVIDNGFGIEPQYHEKIFEKFFRVKNDKTRHIPGTGLGLPIVKGMLQTMGGSITLASEPEKGSTFTVHLPGCKEG
ncbi:MAG: response regulator [Deltaproteobacteria bacterium]|nr:response regulator [Deltaproteobacteria bacterium]